MIKKILKILFEIFRGKNKIIPPGLRYKETNGFPDLLNFIRGGINNEIF